MNKYQLPLFEDKRPLPTNKSHVSFSEIHDFLECQHKHKLKHVDQIKLDDSTIHTVFGGVMHDSIENYFLTKKPFDSTETIKLFKEQLKQISKQPSKEEIDTFMEVIPDIHQQFPDWFNENFPDHKLFGAEIPLFQSIKSQNGISFKGYIDLVFTMPKKKKSKTSTSTRDYYIIDYKTCSWGWTMDQKQSYNKQLQLMLYKHFFCQLMNIDPSDVKCGFILLKRVAPKTRKQYDRLEFVPVSVGPKSLEKSQDTLQDTINRIKKGFVLKNRMACEPFCPYFQTEHCK
jgi:hypothetical protein